MKDHRPRQIKAQEIQQGDMVEIAGWPAIVTYSEPYSDFIWMLEVVGHDEHGGRFGPVTERLPPGHKVIVRRRPKGKHRS